VSCQRGVYGASLGDFDRAIADQPKNAQFYRGRSLARARIGRYREALEDARHLEILAPQQGETHYALGVALAGLGHWREAIRSYDESLRRRPELIYPLRARAAAYRSLGDSLQASIDIEEVARRERENASCAVCKDPFRY
jgi:tetratricopeptide (TPR) repeat protein